MNLKRNKCVVPGCDALGVRLVWFCPFHNKIKEQAYAEARKLGLKNNWAMMALRDKRLNENKNEKTKGSMA